PLLTLSPPSVRWARRGAASFHLRHGWRIPCLHLQPQSPGLRLGPPTQRLHPGSWLPCLHRRPSAHQLRLGRSSTRRRLRTPFLRLRHITPSHRLRRAPPSLQLCLSPLSLRLCHRPPDLRLCFGHPSPGPRLRPPGPWCRLDSLALRLGLHLHLLHRRRSAPWSRQPFLHHGSSLCRLHHGPPSWLRSGFRSGSLLSPPLHPPLFFSTARGG
ncbi:hypothetical protein M9458_003463, partial [Cirrhinus mrigala]